jgi:hypothetical protein
MNLLNLLANLRMFKVTHWDEDSSVTYSTEQREPARDISEANISTSIREDAQPMDSGPMHALLLDLDVPAWLVPSSSQGHSHLYVDVRIPQPKFFALLDALADAGVIQPGYANSSKGRGGTALRLPWIKKPTEPTVAAVATVTELPF